MPAPKPSRVARNPPAPAKRYQCVNCTKSFSKPVYLSRHERSHTNSKPYGCNECGKRFGRSDVRARHLKIHGDSQPVVEPATLQPSQKEATVPGNPSCVGSIELDRPDLAPIPRDEVTGNETLHDSDGLFDWLMSGLNDLPIVPLPLTDFSGVLEPLIATSDRLVNVNGDVTGDRRSEPMGIPQLFTMINDISKRLSAEMNRTRITSDFLDACLHEFFQRISPSFPVIHQATFSSQKSIPPLLLNMVALGSLYVCLPDAVENGELLWRLGHTAVATSWQTLITIRGDHDPCEGVQLVLTALLGQTYALLSANPDIRTTAFVFHGLGFYWARTCGMYARESNPTFPSPDPGLPDAEKKLLWEKWAAAEVQRRAVLGHYILDGLISQASGSPACARHLINTIGAAAPDSLFAATSSKDWMKELSRPRPTNLPMSQIYTRLSRPDYSHTPLDLSSFSISVVLEGLQSLISEAREAGDDAFGVVSRKEVTRMLLNLHAGNIHPLISTRKAHALTIILIRWHAICIEVAAPSTSLYSALCEIFGVPRTVRVPAAVSAHNFHIETWAKSADAVRAALHVMAIIQLLNEIPQSHSHAIHLPAAIFSSALVMSSICLFGCTMFDLPQTSTWEDVWKETPSSTGEVPETADAFLRTLHSITEETETRSVNISNDLNFLQLCLKSITPRWGISGHMEKVTSSLITLIREHGMPVR